MIMINCTDSLNEELKAAITRGNSWSPGIIVAIIVFLVMLPIIVFSNVLVVVCVVKFKRLQIPANYFLCNLAMADILVGISMPMVYLTEYQLIELNSGSTCLIIYCLCIIACSTSLINLTVTAYDRYSALVTPLKYSTLITTRSTIILISLSWLIITCIGFSPMMGWYYTLDYNSCLVCSFHLIHQYCILFLLCIVFFPNFVCICYFYYRIMSIARKQSRAISAIHLAVYPVLINKNLSMQFKGSKYAKTLAILMGIFMLSWLPLIVSLVLEIIYNGLLDYHYLYSYFALLIYCNSALNPWIYSFKNNDFKAALRRLKRNVCASCSDDAPNIGRSASHASLALSRTNSIIATVNLQMLYDSYKEAEAVVEVIGETQNGQRSSSERSTVTTQQIFTQCEIEHHQFNKSMHVDGKITPVDSALADDVSEIDCFDSAIQTDCDSAITFSTTCKDRVEYTPNIRDSISEKPATSDIQELSETEF